jgi:hypothetical protein
LYKVRVRVVDHASNVRVVESANPFYIVRANPDSVQTLVLKNVTRMQALGLASPAQGAALSVKLQELSEHPRVLGFVVDLGAVTDLQSLYADWDADPGNAATVCCSDATRRTRASKFTTRCGSC